MKLFFLSAAAAALIGAASPVASAAPRAAPSAAEARAFVAKAEKELNDVSIYAAHAE